MKLTIEVPYDDIDAMGHLNNVAYLTYLERARQKYWMAMRDSTDFWDVDFVVAHSEIDYRSSVSMGEVLEVEIHVSRMGASSFDFAYAIRRPGAAGGAELVAEAKTTQVSFDWQSRAKKPLSEERRKQIEAFERADAK
ncbi:MAG TPA: thioesterase family protein [Thermoanaerobaculia bacterium]|jgi:acyl-CoA thioester hydrolase